MTINLITFTSVLAPRQSVFTDHNALLSKIEAQYTVNYVFPEDIAACDFSIPTLVLVASGGVEEMIRDCMPSLPEYVLLIADGLKNSLAASLETLSWMRANGRAGRVLHGDTAYIMQGIADFAASFEALRRLSGARVGVIGKPSGWLIASNVDRERLLSAWGVSLIDLPLEEVVSGYEAIGDDEVQDITNSFIAKAKAINAKETNREEIVKAMRLYKSVKAMCEKYNLNAFTLNCFDLIPTTRTTGCVALALLNDEGIPAGCEGDIQTILTMLAVTAATGKPSFMANPSQILDVAAHEMIIAHCTIAPSMTNEYNIRSHFESQSGVALEGILSCPEVTVAKCGGKDMKRFFVSGAALIECLDNPIMCRTQLHIKLDASPEYFLHESIGNHHVIVAGNHVPLLTSLFRLLTAK